MNGDPGNAEFSSSSPDEGRTLCRMVEVWRGAACESVHYGAVAVCDAAGQLVASAGSPDLLTFMRSAAKPVQLLPLIESGAADHFGFSDAELAIMAASHTGLPMHLELVQRILDRIGLSPADLLCGVHAPFDSSVVRDLLRQGREPGVLHNNCSGKHAGMLAYCRYHQLPLDYLAPDHPLQHAILKTLAQLAGMRVSEIQTAVDGCGVPCYALPLRNAARVFATFADADASAAEPRQRAMARICRVMAANPEAVGGPGRLDTELIQVTAGQVIAKSGAESFQALVLPRDGLGVAIKVIDGQGSRALGPAVISLMEQLDLPSILGLLELPRLAELRRPHIRNHQGAVVGHLQPALTLKF
jgi:L-asparaginase II